MRFTTNVAVALGGLLAVLAALAITAHQAKQDGIAEARSQAHREYLVRVDSLEGAWATRLADLEASYAQAARVDTVTRLRYRSLVDTLTITDTIMVREALDRCDAGLAACDSVNVVLLGRVALEAERSDTLAVALERTRAAWQTELRRRRGFLHSVKTGIPYLAAGLALGIIIK